ncbi:hypothetical protein OnM2_022105 [Erysiphe neolycopersici]|uniref:Uncharacterized protein n=1 Tax=Erysiphe neolycopersici TaxID=212602 RepID=A0A420I2J9_9PEZI|nr:hypothetical protein OnM2_022105 [Erysiphe neolycopersici]
MSSTTSLPIVGNPKPNSNSDSDASKIRCPPQVLEAIKNFSTIDETLKQGVPKDFQIIVRPRLKTTYDYTLKLHYISESITRIERLVNDNTCPLQIMDAIKQPKL